MFVDDAALGGSFTYQTFDGTTASVNTATVTVDNNAATSTTLSTTSGGTILVGNNAAEALNGASGNDVLIANNVNQILTGGGGNDVFAFEHIGSGPNATITDFNNTTAHDLFAISASGFGGNLTAGLDASTVFESSADESFASVFSRFHYNTATDTLSFSPDGTDASAVVVAHLQPGVTLTGHDFVIVA